MTNLVKTDFNQQGINSLNMGMGIGNAMQRNRQIGIDQKRQAESDDQKRQLFGQQMQMGDQQIQIGDQKINQQERMNGMSEMVLALNLPFDKRNELFAELEAKKQNPDAKAALSHLQTLDDEEQLTTMLEMLNSQQSINKKGKSELPAESLAFNDLIKDFSAEEQKLARRVKAGTKGRAVSNAILSAIESGDITNLAEAKAEIKQAEKFSEMTATSRAKAIDKGFEGIVKIDAGIKNIDRAMSALGSGAGVGAIEKLWPSIKASSVELDNIRGQMALDVVGATTFGALSAGELALAKDIALPIGLDTDELMDYLTRKKAAQEKLRNYYNEQIQFLDQGGTIAGFLRSKEKSREPEINQGNTGSPTIGKESDGYRFMGGDPSLKESWSKI